MRRNAARAALVLSCVLAAAARAQDPGSVAELGQLLMLEDRREFDGAALQRAVQHPDARVRERAAMTLGRLGDRAATPLLVFLLRDADSTVRAEAAFALGELGDPAAVTELAALADRFEPVVTDGFAVEIVTALAKIGGADAERALERLLERHPPVDAGGDRATAQALLELWRLGRTSALARRLPDYVRSARGEWRRNATYSATRLPVPAAAPALLEAAGDDDAYTRQWAVRGLIAPMADSSGISRATFTSALRGHIGDRDAQVRINALRSLSTFQDSSLAPLAAARLADRDPNVAVEAATTLGRLGGARAAAALAERFPSAGSSGLRRAIVVSLARIDTARALALTAAWRTDADWRQRAGYLEVLATIRSAAVRARLEAMLADADPRVAALALGALGGVAPPGDSVLLDHARRMLGAADVGVRTAAIQVLGRERRAALVPELVAAYRQAETEAHNDARLAAVDALGAVADAGGGPAVEAQFLAATGRSNDFLVRRLAARRFGDAYVRTWRTVLPVETGRSAEEYRDLARRYVLRAETMRPVTIETERGSIRMQLFGYDAPLTVDNFTRLADRRYFDNGRWHRVVPNFVVQDGDPRGDGSGGPGTVIRDEINRRRYGRGAVGMALAGPDTGGSQFFLTHSPQPHLDGGYTVFGEVIAGWDVLDQIVQGDRIRRIYR